MGLGIKNRLTVLMKSVKPFLQWEDNVVREVLVDCLIDVDLFDGVSFFWANLGRDTWGFFNHWGDPNKIFVSTYLRPDEESLDSWLSKTPLQRRKIRYQSVAATVAHECVHRRQFLSNKLLYYVLALPGLRESFLEPEAHELEDRVLIANLI